MSAQSAPGGPHDVAETVVAQRPPKRRVRDPLVRWMRRRNWNYQKPQDGLRHRLYDLVSERHPWYDWGHQLMILTGSDFGGNWSEPSPPTWWYRLGPPKHMVRTGYPRHPLSTFEIVTEYDEFRARTKGLNEDQMYEWKAIGTNQDGDLHLGHRYWGGTFYGMPECEVALLRRYLRMWHRLDWFGLRSWLYSQGLHAAVNHKVPWTCQVSPPKGSGGYSHWFCDQKRKHSGPHRYRNYEWDPTKDRVEHTPTKQEIARLEEALGYDGQGGAEPVKLCVKPERRDPHAAL
jgi:hypothetical protein